MRRVSLRHDVPGVFLTDEKFNEVMDEYIAARARARELGRRHTIAPRQSLTVTRDGKQVHLLVGDAVFVTDFKHIREQREWWGSTLDRSPWEQLEKLVLSGFVIEADVPEPTPPEAA